MRWKEGKSENSMIVLMFSPSCVNIHIAHIIFSIMYAVLERMMGKANRYVGDMQGSLEL